MIGKKNLNSTKLARRTFRDVVTPIAARSPASRLDFAMPKTDGSYFNAPKRASLTLANLTAIENGSLFSSLKNIWNAEGYDELNELLPHLEKIAKALEKEREEAGPNDEGPSPLIYQMH